VVVLLRLWFYFDCYKLEQCEFLGRLDFGQRFNSFVDVRCGISEFVVNHLADSVLVQDIGDTTREQAKGSTRDAELLSYGVAFIGQDGKAQAKLFSELLLGFGTLSRDSDDFSAECLSDFLDSFIESLGLDSASWRGVSGVEVDDKGLLDGRAGHCLAILVLQGEIRSSFSNSKVESSGDLGSAHRVGSKGSSVSKKGSEGKDGKLHFDD
jgi:hypothetical protein